MYNSYLRKPIIKDNIIIPVLFPVLFIVLQTINLQLIENTVKTRYEIME